MADQHTLNELLSHYQITRWDILVVNDGSGQTWKHPAGWAAMLITREGMRQWLLGRMNVGTNNVAEIMPTLHALRYDFYGTNGGKLLVSRCVHVISDSQITVNVGNKLWQPHANGDLWASLNYFRDVGYEIHFHHIDRNSNPLHAEVDRLSKANTPLEGLTLLDPYSIMPWVSQCATPPQAS